MAITVSSQSTLTLSGSDQAFGSAITSIKTVVFQADLSTMAAGDIIEIACYMKTAGTGDTLKQAWRIAFADVQGQPVYQSIPMCAPYSVEFRGRTAAGTNRTIPYVLFTLD